MEATTTKRQEMESKIIEICFKDFNPNHIYVAVKELKRSLLNEFFKKIDTEHFIIPSESDIEKLLMENIEWTFDDDKIAAYIKRTFPGWNEDRIDSELSTLEEIYEYEYSKRMVSFIKNAAREIRGIVGPLREDIDKLKEKYLQ
ncbi:MAG: hypothetical protein HQK76_04645 [Desulfobacterales bacterium]|nr:hypothetical protein [Desulfobacterales bacterium]